MLNTTRLAKAALTLLPPAALNVAFVVIGWGIDDLAGLFSNRARDALIGAVAFAFIFGTLLAVEFKPFRKGDRKGRGWPIIAGMFTVPLLWGAAAFCDRRNIWTLPPSSFIRFVGVATYLIGDCVRLLALHELGRYYSAYLTVQPEHALIRRGLYRWIRHPFYLGQLLTVPGALLAFRNDLAVVIFVLSVAFVVTRIGREEQLLLGHFAGAYAEYQRHSWRLLPFVY